MSGMSDYAFSVKMRDTIASMIESTIEKIRPSDRYGVVNSVDTANRKVGVTLNGETAPVLVSYGALVPSVGQTVRVGGTAGDKSVRDIIGDTIGLVPIGSVTAWVTATAPTNWLLCQGQTVLRATYPDLYAVIGGTFNWGGEDATNFRLPYLIDGYEPKGVGASYPLGQYGGASTRTLTSTELPSHNHTGVDHLHSTGSLQKTASAGGGAASDNASGSVAQGATSGRFIGTQSGSTTTGAADRSLTTGSAGSGGAFNIMNLYLGMNFIIRAA